jgi:hypothetical protein
MDRDACRDRIASANHPNYLDPNVIIGGFMSHFFYTVPLALVVKRRLMSTAGERSIS